jgi:hypothetical protein
MNITTLEVAGLSPAIYAMRNPMNSWMKCDSPREFGAKPGEFTVGPADKDLSIRLQKAGPEHCKHLRMIMAWANIDAPRYWWTEFDTYRYGVEKVSCSTMHKLMAKPLTEDDFEIDDRASIGPKLTIDYLNSLMNEYKEEEDPVEKKAVWRHIIQNLPQSYLQKRTVMMSYAAIRNIYRQREGHKLAEWQAFRKWAESLPESWMITE